MGLSLSQTIELVTHRKGNGLPFAKADHNSIVLATALTRGLQ
jgi:hypothetical protein